MIMIQLTEMKPTDFDGDLLIYFIQETGSKTVFCPETALRGYMRSPWKKGDFRGKNGETFLFYPPTRKKIAADRVLLVGLGKKEKKEHLCREQLRAAVGTAIQKGRTLKAVNLLAVLPEKTGLADDAVAECVSEGLVLANYSFDRYKSGKKKKIKKGDRKENQPIEQFFLSPGVLKRNPVRKGMKQGEGAALAACAARDMANEPGNGWTPARFADFGRQLAQKSDLECTIIEKEEMKKLGMGGILGVNQGSNLPPKLVILKYKAAKKRGAKKPPTLMLVGKGLTFDSGGISLKPAAGMEDMKYDMCGGAAVISAMQEVAREKPRGINIIALIPATENLSGGSAIKPGDVITHYNGITSEIINTDAEGRMILADALAYGIDTFKPDAVIDLATLTGAVIVGLGHHRTGLLGTDDSLAERVMAAGERAGEPCWRLPLGSEYSKLIESQVADIKNTGGKSAGTITAAAYLQEFVGDTPWVHLDIAGTAWNFTKKSYIPKGPSGIAVRTLLNLIRDWD